MRWAVSLMVVLLLVAITVVPETEGSWLTKWLRNRRYTTKGKIDNRKTPTYKIKQRKFFKEIASQDTKVKRSTDYMSGMRLPSSQAVIQAPAFWKQWHALCLNNLKASGGYGHLSEQDLLQALQGADSEKALSICGLLEEESPGTVQHRIQDDVVV